MVDRKNEIDLKNSLDILKGMNVRKCDICKKEIKYENSVRAAVEYISKEFCLECGKPVLNFLRKYKFIDKNNKEIK